MNVTATMQAWSVATKSQCRSVLTAYRLIYLHKVLDSSLHELLTMSEAKQGTGLKLYLSHTIIANAKQLL